MLVEKRRCAITGLVTHRQARGRRGWWHVIRGDVYGGVDGCELGS